MQKRLLASDFMKAVSGIKVEKKYHHAWKKLYAAMTKKGGKLSQQDMNAILALSPPNFEKFVKKADSLYMSDQLTSEAVSRALYFVIHKVPSVPASKMIYKNKHHGVATERKFDNGLVLFSKKGASRDNIPGSKKHHHAIKGEGYKLPIFGNPDFIVKRFHQDEVKAARREVKGLRLVGRPVADWYESKRGPVVVTNFIDGETLLDLFENGFKFKKYSIAERLKMFASILADVDVIHENGLVHGDLAPAKLMLADGMIKLTDYSTLRKIGSNNKRHCANEYRDPDHFPNHPGSDMYTLGFSFAILFPELFYLLMSGNTVSVVKAKEFNLSNMDIALMNLLDALMEYRRDFRCTAETAIRCIQEMIDKSSNDDLNDDQLIAILKATINRDTFTVRDALLDSKRPQKFIEGADQTGGYARMLGIEGVANAKAFAAMFRVSRKSQLTAKTTIIDKIVERKLKQ